MTGGYGPDGDQPLP